MIKIQENELYQELELHVGDEKIGEAEIDIKNRMLSRLMIYPQFQSQGYGTEAVKILTEKYRINVLWVNADNFSAIKCYEKNGYRITQNTMYKMEKHK